LLLSWCAALDIHLQVRNAALAPLAKHKQFPDGFPAERIVFIVSSTDSQPAQAGTPRLNDNEAQDSCVQHQVRPSHLLFSSTCLHIQALT
jgi:hypothetical protein